MSDSREDTMETLLRRAVEERDREIARLREALESCEHEKREVLDQGMRDFSTGYYARPYFRKHLADAVLFARDLRGGGSVVAAYLDGFDKIVGESGTSVAEDLAARTASFFRAFFPRDAPAFRYETDRFAWSLLEESTESALRRAEAARVALSDSDAFERPMRASFAVLDLAEVVTRRGTLDEAADAALDILNRRLDSAERDGGDRVFSTDRLEELSGPPLAYIVDPDPWHASVLAERLEGEGWEVRKFADGASALEALSKRKPSIVVSELTVPQGDGFALRRYMRGSSSLEDVPFVLIADFKDSASARTAAELGIVRYYKKPYFLSEIVGILNQLVGPDSRGPA